MLFIVQVTLCLHFTHLCTQFCYFFSILKTVTAREFTAELWELWRSGPIVCDAAAEVTRFVSSEDGSPLTPSTAKATDDSGQSMTYSHLWTEKLRSILHWVR